MGAFEVVQESLFADLRRFSGFEIGIWGGGGRSWAMLAERPCLTVDDLHTSTGIDGRDSLHGGRNEGGGIRRFSGSTTRNLPGEKSEAGLYARW